MKRIIISLTLVMTNLVYAGSISIDSNVLCDDKKVEALNSLGASTEENVDQLNNAAHASLFEDKKNRKKLNKFCKKSHDQYVYSVFAKNNKGKLIPKSTLTIKEKETGETYNLDYNGNASFYRGCSQNIDWMMKLRKNLCERDKLKKSGLSLKAIQSIKLPKEFYFFFDGAGDFSAQRGARSLGAVNVKGDEGRDLGMGNFNGGSVFRSILSTNSPIKKEERQVHYHASSGFHQRESSTSGLACGKQIDQYLEVFEFLGKDTEDVKWITAGFSNGGMKALDFQKYMGKKDRAIDLAIIIDPIPQTLFYPLGKLRNRVGAARHSNTKRLVNIYQQEDKDTVPLLRLRGGPVKNADKNILVKDSDHLSILYSRELRHTISCEIHNLSAKDKDIKDCDL